MPHLDRDRLRSIKAFPSLVKYLRDELDWPINTDDFDDLTFEYEAEELGIDPKTAAKIQKIKQLRPLTTRQPWGIFFLKFEPKRLPVVALRRILSQLVFKKRASARKTDQPSWHLDDLLFISNYGEGKEDDATRQITFAHFSQDEEKLDLPTLKVLGWDNQDTALHLEDVAESLTTKLVWPRDVSDVDAWRKTWRSAFVLGHREVVTTSRELSVRLAQLARSIRDRIKTALTIETDRGPLKRLMKAFREALVHDLDEDGFADMYAQTIAYGLLSTRIANPRGITTDHLSAQMPVTNPFLKELMETFIQVGGRRGKAGGPGIDFDELGVSEVVELLDDANMEAVVRDFGDKNPQEDPVIHFYELFLKEYDAKKRMQRGVFYTPRPVVSYIIRSVDELLRTEFGLEDGLADTTSWEEMVKLHPSLKIPDGIKSSDAFVQILDPATGTGTFLVEVIDTIHRTLVAKWKNQGQSQKQIDSLWNEYVPAHLLSRLHGYELLMAPYAIAHLKIGLKLYETGYRFDHPKRARIYLTNALEPASDSGKQIEFKEWIPALANEAREVNEVKKRQCFTIIIGNPPYSGRSYNLTDYAREMVRQYKTIAGLPIKEKGALQLEKNLNDDYVKFVSLAQMLTKGHPATVGLITNHSFLENPTLRGLRWHLLQQYASMRLLDLGGNVARRERGVDDNVFDISQGVAISILASPPERTNVLVRVTRLRGTREEKYRTLLLTEGSPLSCTLASPVEPFFLFRSENVELRTEYMAGLGLTECFPLNSTGVKTHRDAFCIDFDIVPLKRRIADLISYELSDADIRDKYGLEDTYGWDLKKCRMRLRSQPNVKDAFTQILYRPFDWRNIYFSAHVIELPRMEVSENFLHGDNIGIVFMRQVASDESYCHFGVTRNPVDNRCFYSNRGTMSFAPLFIDRDYSGPKGLFKNRLRNPNLSSAAMEAIGKIVGDTKRIQITAEAILNYAYGVFHSPAYRSRYAEFLKIDFPRIPLPRHLNLFYDIARLGGEIVSLHLMESPCLDKLVTTYLGSKDAKVERVGWSADTVWLDAARTKKEQLTNPGTIGFLGVPAEVWNFQIGGYQVCEKWLKDRKGRQLSADDIAHYQKIVVAISETIRLMKEIDEVIEAHGGWPGAFLTERAKTAPAKSS